MQPIHVCNHTTPEAIYPFDARGVAKRFRHAAIFGALDSLHPGETVDSVRAATGFDFDVEADIPATPDPTEAELALLRGRVCDEMAETYPEFCKRVWGRTRAA